MFQKRRWESVEAWANCFQLEAWHEMQVTGVSKAVKSSHLLPWQQSVTTVAHPSWDCLKHVPRTSQSRRSRKLKKTLNILEGKAVSLLFLLNCKHTFYVNAGDTNSGTCDGRAIVLTHCTTSLALLESPMCNSLFFLIKNSGKLAFDVPVSICLGDVCLCCGEGLRVVGTRECGV